MLKAAGAVLIMTACCFWAFSAVGELRRHVRTLESLAASMNVLEGEIFCRLSPLGDVVRLLADNAQEPACCFYKRVDENMEKLGESSFYAIWREAVVNCSELNLTREENELLCELGMSLGRYDVDKQAQAIKYTERQLEYMVKRASEQSRKDGKLHAVFPLLAGVFVIIILL